MKISKNVTQWRCLVAREFHWNVKLTLGRLLTYSLKYMTTVEPIRDPTLWPLLFPLLLRRHLFRLLFPHGSQFLEAIHFRCFFLKPFFFCTKLWNGSREKVNHSLTLPATSWINKGIFLFYSAFAAVSPLVVAFQAYPSVCAVLLLCDTRISLHWTPFSK